MLKVGDKFRLTNNARYHYNDISDRKCNGVYTVSHVAVNRDQHPGYDDGMNGMPLYDSDDLPFSVYEYEIEEV